MPLDHYLDRGDKRRESEIVGAAGGGVYDLDDQLERGSTISWRGARRSAGGSELGPRGKRVGLRQAGEERVRFARLLKSRRAVCAR